MGRVVGCSHINSAVLNALNERQPVLLGAQWRIHFEGAAFLKVVFIKHKVVRTCFAGDVNALCLGLSYNINALLCGDVTDVVGTANALCERNIPLNRSPFALGADTAMTVRSRVIAIVNISCVKKRIVLLINFISKKDPTNININITDYVIKILEEGQHSKSIRIK